MEFHEVTKRLEAVREQQYPLSVDDKDGDAFVNCIQRIWSAVPEDEKIILCGDYALITSALQHPNIPPFSE